MPIVVSIRKDFSSSVFRDAVVRTLYGSEITHAYIASGFFEDFTASLETFAPDFGFSGAMEGKQIFLFGGYNRKNAESKLLELRRSLRSKKIQAETYLPKVPVDDDEPELVWHAKLAVFLNQSGPVLAIAGSSNFTGSSMFGPSNMTFIKRIQKVSVEADTYFWKKGCVDVDDAMHRALNEWKTTSQNNTAFDNAQFDEEIGKLIEYTYLSILNSAWDKLP